MNEKPAIITWNSPAVFPSDSRPVLLTVADLRQLADGIMFERDRYVYRGVYAHPSSVEVQLARHLYISEYIDKPDGYWYLKPGYYAEGPTGYWPVDGGWTRLCGWAEMVEPMRRVG